MKNSLDNPTHKRRANLGSTYAQAFPDNEQFARVIAEIPHDPNADPDLAFPDSNTLVAFTTGTSFLLWWKVGFDCRYEPLDS